MIDSLMKNTGKVAKYLIGAGFIGALLLVGALRGCSTDNSTNRHDATNTKTIVDGSIELQKMENEKQERMAENAAIERSADASAAVKINSSDNETAVELKKTLDVTSIETKKLEMQDKSILDVNKSEEMKMQLEMKKLELIEAQKLKNEFEIEKLKLDNEALLKEKQAAAAAAKANAAAAKVKAAAAEKARKEKEEIDILKSIAN
ncbi:MAG: hypothetical protein ACRDA0_10710 [Cetobacterium sp.]|uniref:hypothetical protein n=1 Tax=Cetobacterium sp. TaxID=2071632 RepID=UPI003F2F6B3E